MGILDLAADQQASLLQALVRNSNSAVVASDAEGRITLMGPALDAFLAHGCQTLPAADVVRLFQLRDAETSHLLNPEQVPVIRAARGEVLHDVVVSVQRPDGGTMFLRCSGGPLRSVDGSIAGGVIQATDVTTEVLLTRQQGTLRDRLVDTINHELRTPLTKLVGYAELLEDARETLPDNVRRWVAAVLEAGEGLKDLARTVSELVDLDSASLVEATPVEVGDLVRAIMARVEPAAQQGGIRMALTIRQPVRICLDETRVGKALEGLLTNAVTHSPRNGVVEVRLDGDERSVWFDVSDAGPGIPVTERARVVQPFERGDRPEQPVSARGLGLATAHAVALAHGGALNLHDAVPRGLRVRLRLKRWVHSSEDVEGCSCGDGAVGSPRSSGSPTGHRQSGSCLPTASASVAS